MISFFRQQGKIYAVKFQQTPSEPTLQKLEWLFGDARHDDTETIAGFFVGPRREMITPWSTNAVEITQNMGIEGIQRIEEFYEVSEKDTFDHMLRQLYKRLDQEIFTIDIKPEPLIEIDDIPGYNQKEGLALSSDEIRYLEELSKKLNRKLTDSEIFGFSQVNSEHCRHKIFNGSFVIDGQEQGESLFSMIKKTSKSNPGFIVSAYKDNVAFIEGPEIEQFAPETQDKPDFFALRKINSVLSLKAETHNFPTTVEPFNGAATGSGGEIRDRMAGGKGSIPVAGTAVYMTSYPRLGKRSWETAFKARKWLYQTPLEILIKASNGASDFGNKFGQPLICGSVLTFEHFDDDNSLGYDKVIMLAGGIGFGKKEDALKAHPQKGDKVVVLGGDNYRIGMGGGAVSSVATGEYKNAIELNAVQRSNPEMQKRIYNALRALAESEKNPIISVHDHGAGGHLNCLSELVENEGGVIDISRLPVGDPTLSLKEIIGNESQERMGLIVHPDALEELEKIAARERAPMYVVGEITGDHKFVVEKPGTGEKPIDLEIDHLLGKTPRTVILDHTENVNLPAIQYDENQLYKYVENLLQLEAVACKDWLTNKVDRSVTGRIAHQQTAGPLQLPLNNLGVIALSYNDKKGIATSIGHAPVSAIIDPAAGSVLSVAEALTNLVWAPLDKGLDGVSLSANWMWPGKSKGEDSRLYKAVKAISDFSIELGINIPTGKDSLSMTQKYPDGSAVKSPGTVIVSAVAEVSDIKSIVSPVLKPVLTSSIVYIDFSGTDFCIGGSSFAQLLNKLGTGTPKIESPEYFKKTFNTVQELIKNGKILAGHDIGSGGLITTLLEMTFSHNGIALEADLTSTGERDIVKVLFSEKPAVVVQTNDLDFVMMLLEKEGIKYNVIGKIIPSDTTLIRHYEKEYHFRTEDYRKYWFKTSCELDKVQSGDVKALERFNNFAQTERNFVFPTDFTGKLRKQEIDPFRRLHSGLKAAIVREKGSNGDREMAWSLYLAGFDVKDVHMTDLISGRETLDEIRMLVFVGGFSNSDVLGSAKGWAGAFLYNEKAKQALDKYYSRKDTLSLGVCNGCQLMAELGLIYPKHEVKHKMLHNDSGKYESSFVTVKVPENNSVMLSNLAGSTLGVWIAHGEGKFYFPYEENRYLIPMKYAYSHFPGNPNGSMFDAAAVVSADGRHLAMMPHIERSIYSWQWGFYPDTHKNDEVTPWVKAFLDARRWIEEN